MKIKIILVLSLLILASAGFALSEDQTAGVNALPASAPSAAPSSVSPQEGDDSANTQWVWGEVTSIDAQNKTLNLKYLDYETDQEKEMAMTTDLSTSYDNAKTLDDIQPKDNISVDYIVKDGKNIAKAISLEKAENAPAVVTTTQTDAQAPQSNQ